MTQAARVLAKFGGPRALQSILASLGIKYNLTSIYRWNYPRSKGGRGGIIPACAWPDVLLAARVEGVYITSEDMDPRKAYPRPENQSLGQLKRRKGNIRGDQAP